MTKKKLALEVIERLKKEYPDSNCTLAYDKAWQLLVSVRLAAQCTDKRVDMISKHLTSLTDYIYRLPPGNARNVLIYHYIDGLKFSEICVELRYSERQVYRLHRIGIEFLSKLAQDVSE